MNDQFGNIIEPDPVAFSFAAPGWAMLVIAMVVIMIITVAVWLYRYHKNEYRRNEYQFRLPL